MKFKLLTKLFPQNISCKSPSKQLVEFVYSLSIMTLADPGSGIQVLGLGISVIVLNIGMYVVAPVGAVIASRKILK